MDSIDVKGCKDYREYLAQYLLFYFEGEDATEFLKDIISGSKHYNLLSKEEFDIQKAKKCENCKNPYCKCLKKLKNI